MNNKKLPYLSIIIVTYNSEDTINSCLDAIYKQDFIDYEIIVIDNGSTDNTINICRQHESKPFVLNAKRNLGFGVGNNLGVYYSVGTLLVFVNPDTYLENDALNNIKKHYHDDKFTGILGGQLEENNITLRPYPSPFNILKYHRGSFSEITPSRTLTDVSWVCGAFFCIPKKLFNSVYGFDNDYFLYYEETDLCKKVKEVGKRVCVATDIKGKHTGGCSSKKVSGGIDSQKMIPRFRYLSYIIFLRKHYGLFLTIVSILHETILKSLRILFSFRKHNKKEIIMETTNDIYNLFRSALETRIGKIIPKHPWSPL